MRARQFTQGWVACCLVTLMFLGCGGSEGLDHPAACEGCGDSGAAAQETGKVDGAPVVDSAPSSSTDGSSDSAQAADSGHDDDGSVDADGGAVDGGDDGSGGVDASDGGDPPVSGDAGDDAASDAATDASSDAAPDASDPEPLPTLTIQPDSWQEGKAGTTVPFQFVVTLSQPSSSDVLVDYATADNTATSADNDYVATSGTLTILAGKTSGTINVSGIGDNKVEPTETFFVNLKNAKGATIAGNGQAVGMLVNDDTPSLSIAPVSQAEGNAGTSKMTFTVLLSQASSDTVTVKYATGSISASTFPGTPGNADYDSATGTLTFLPGVTQQTFDVTVHGDAVYEVDETFSVSLSNATNATIATANVRGTITNDDDAPSISVDDVSVAEGNNGLTFLKFTFSLSAVSGATTTVVFNEAGGTAIAGVNYPADFQATAGIMSFPAGITSAVLNVTVLGDTDSEANETMCVNLSNPTNATIAKAQGVGTIVNDD